MGTYFLKIVGLITIGVFGRLIPHVPNLTPLTGLSVFAGINLPRSLAILVILLTLIISDVGLALVWGYPIGGYFTLFTYTGFLGIALIGSKFKYSKWSVPVSLLGASLGFWLWTNFGVWLTAGLYPKTLKGLGVCYYMALPFLRQALVGDIVWGCVIFGFARVAKFGRRAGFRFQ